MPDEPPKTVLLAAGAGRRMGRPKALLDWFGVPLVNAHLEALGPQTTVVLGAAHERIRDVLPAGTRIVVNPAWAESGMAHSALLGIGPGDRAVIIGLVDTVPDPAIIALLRGCTATTVPLDRDGRPGHPIRLEADAVARLRSMPQPNLRSIVQGARHLDTSSLTCALDFDTPEELERAKRVARGGLEPPTPRV